MPRSRGSEMSQTRLSPRAPLHLKSTACSEANSVHRHSSDRSSSADDRRSPRSPLNERKKASSRVADLETKLGQAQEELKKLKEELTAAEEARRDAQTELEETKKLFPLSPPTNAAQDTEDVKEKTMNVDVEKVDDEQGPVLEEMALPGEEDCVNFPTTDVFEVAPVKDEGDGSIWEVEDADEGTEMKGVIGDGNRKEEVEIEEKEKEEEQKLESAEMSELRALMAEKENQLESVLVQNRILKKEADEAQGRSAAATAKAEEMLTKLAGAEEELSLSKMTAERLREKLDTVETAKASLEAEMKRLRIQTEQWRKAAEAAAAVLAADGASLNEAELSGRKLGESCRSMEKHLRGYDTTAGDGGWSPVIAGGKGDEVNHGAKRRGAGGRIQVLGELWKKKSHLK